MSCKCALGFMVPPKKERQYPVPTTRPANVINLFDRRVNL